MALKRKPGVDWTLMTFEMLQARKGLILSHDPTVDGVKGQIIPVDILLQYIQANFDLNVLSDVAFSGPQAGQVLTYDGSKWTSQDVPLQLNYSLSEQDTGRKDPHGRSIYQKTWFFANGSGTQQPLAGITSNIVQNIWMKQASYQVAGENGEAERQFSVNQGIYWPLDPDSPATVLFDPAVSQIYFTLQYTKN